MNLKKIPIGKDNFQDLINDDCYYVDKTIAIEELLNKGSSVVLYPRPRRFGKSLFISMLENFFDIDKKNENAHLFDGLAIQKSEYYKEFGNYPVIALDFKDLKQNEFEITLDVFKNMLSSLYATKEYIYNTLSDSDKIFFDKIRARNSTLADCKVSILNLCQWLEKYHNQKVIILVDEYDVPIQQGYLSGFYDEVVNFIRSVLSSCLKGNDSLKFGVLTGVLRVSKESIFSDLNNLTIYDMMSKNYNEAFGFTEKETKELLEYYGLELTNEVKEYYDGYNFMGASIYNPWSILNYVDNNTLRPYWVNTSGNVLIKTLLSGIIEQDREEIEKLLKGESISFSYDERITYQDFNETDISKVLNLLFASGYLTYDREYQNPITKTTKYYFKIPNEEVRYDLVKIVQTIEFKKEITGYEEYDNFMESILLGNKEKIESYLNKLLTSISFYDRKESFYHGYMIGLFGGFLTSRFIVKSNRESGSGRYDVLIEKKDRSFGCILEFKMAEEESIMESIAENARKQMKEKEYYKELELDQVTNIKEYAIVFSGKKCIVR